ncbi:MAG: acyl-CoA dehydratase activase [Erysipelotrichaceae bacterium]
MSYKLGLDIGSTTIKAVVLDDNNDIVYKSYERHMSRVREMALDKLVELRETFGNHSIKASITGSAGLGLAKIAEISFVQEVFATAGAVRKFAPESDVVIELGGEDAKIIFLKGTLEERMNSTCAGGTGAFIDQMSSLLNLNPNELDALSLQHTKLYPIASRCGVFAKTDIQPLINQGADKANIAASIFQAVVDQTIAGLAQGRDIEGNVLFLGGPLSFLKGLQQRFIETLKLDKDKAIFPDLAPYYIALGAATYAIDTKDEYSYTDLLQRFTKVINTKIENKGLPPLFINEEAYRLFQNRHSKSNVKYINIAEYIGEAYLGIDAGSTTTKIVLMTPNNEILYSNYSSNQGSPIDVIKEQLIHIYNECGNNIKIASCAVTGYGEELMRKAFHVDFGVVETIAHYSAAKYFNPKVDFIIDIGGQDMKCFRIKDESIDDIILNEACSSGCGSFIETFAKSLGYDISEFASLGLKGQSPVDLGTRCTVFMNSSVKQAQKNGASIEDISAGLATSVVKNALYKVIRIKDVNDLGNNIVVQGGTFLNDTVLRSFEVELGKNVIRPSIAGLMGAFGAAMYAKKHKVKASTLLSLKELQSFTHTSSAINCKGCTNHCNLTINKFVDGSRHIAGNKCEKPTGNTITTTDLPNLYETKYDMITSYATLSNEANTKSPLGTIGIPMVLNMYENVSFWHTFLTELGFEVVYSDRSNKQLYLLGQHTISSDTVCYPAKLVHGHIQSLINKKVDRIFYPCLTYNFEEHISDNHFNCPVVAYYPEVISANMNLEDIPFLYPYLALDDPKRFNKKMMQYLKLQGINISKQKLEAASTSAYSAYATYKEQVFIAGEKALNYALANDKNVIVLAGRPYHIDPEINHGIHKLLNSLGFVVISEDSIRPILPYDRLNILNQWTYHARMYNAAKYVTTHSNVELVQLVSFGCGIDAVTTDEVKSILQDAHRLYTQIKIDEIDNLGAIKIRIRSLLAAMEERK